MRALDEAIAKRLVLKKGKKKPLKDLRLTVEEVIQVMSGFKDKPTIPVDIFFILVGIAKKEVICFMNGACYYRGYRLVAK